MYKTFACACGKTHTVENLNGLRQALYEAHGEIIRMRMLLDELQAMVYPLGDAWKLIQNELRGGMEYD